MNLRNILCFLINVNCNFRIPAPKLPKDQDCHELWSKKRRRLLRDQEITLGRVSIPPLVNEGGQHRISEELLSDVGG